MHSQVPSSTPKVRWRFRKAHRAVHDFDCAESCQTSNSKTNCVITIINRKACDSCYAEVVQDMTPVKKCAQLGNEGSISAGAWEWSKLKWSKDAVYHNDHPEFPKNTRSSVHNFFPGGAYELPCFFIASEWNYRRVACAITS
mmetsp:Transcript_8545/g.19795  ORF Transcript_8545/g.19795 Transcript_8545/m.19795 type:complete len:142 (-) Transcript_8545:97-522(-)